MKSISFQKDFSASDRCFAINCGICFKTPEEYFLSAAPEKFALPNEPQNELKDKSSKLEKRLSEVELLQNGGQTIFICVGYPGSGKSSFGKQLVEKSPNLKICCRDELGSTDKSLKITKNYIKNKNHVYVDSTNPGRPIHEYKLQFIQKRA